MDLKSAIIGLLAGAIVGFVASKAASALQTSANLTVTDSSSLSSLQQDSTHNWLDSLDAVKRAPASHKIVYEDSLVRILQVLLPPGEQEPVHIHQWSSVMWFNQATPMIYYEYELSNGTPKLKDSITIPQMPPEVLNNGSPLEPEGPHAIKNTGTETGIAYRVEFKQGK